MPLLFSYGTLQDESVQVSTFGRTLVGRRDELIGFELDTFTITDADFVKRSGKAQHAIVRPSANPNARVQGTVLELTEDELARSDAYEPDGYTRVSAPLASGGTAWVYSAATR